MEECVVQMSTDVTCRDTIMVMIKNPQVITFFPREWTGGFDEICEGRALGFARGEGPADTGEELEACGRARGNRL